MRYRRRQDRPLATANATGAAQALGDRLVRRLLDRVEIVRRAVANAAAAGFQPHEIGIIFVGPGTGLPAGEVPPNTALVHQRARWFEVMAGLGLDVRPAIEGAIPTAYFDEEGRATTWLVLLPESPAPRSAVN